MSIGSALIGRILYSRGRGGTVSLREWSPVVGLYRDPVDLVTWQNPVHIGGSLGGSFCKSPSNSRTTPYDSRRGSLSLWCGRGAENENFSHTKSRNLPTRLRSKRGGCCGYGVEEYGMESGRAERLAIA